MKIVHSREAGASENRTGGTFDGEVWGDPVLVDGEVSVNSVFFAPGGRTHWHRHGIAQVLLVTHGRGFVWSDEGHGSVIEVGDVVHIPAGERHWHGGTPTTFLVHHAVSIGTTEWLEPVADADYAQVATALEA